MSTQKVIITEHGTPLEGSADALIESRIKYPIYADLEIEHEKKFHLKDLFNV